MQYVVDIIDAIAWPVCIVIMALVFRKQIAGMLGQIEQLKYKDLEAKFRKQLDTIESKAKDVGLISPDDTATIIPGLPEDVANQIYRISEFSPRAAVSETWVLLEGLISNLLEQHSLSALNSTPAITKLRALSQSGVIDPGLVPILDELREVRNNVQHVPDFVVTSVEAQRYFFWAGALYQQLQLAKKK